MRGSPDWQDDQDWHESASSVREPIWKIAAQCVAGWAVGCLVILLLSVLFFKLMHLAPGIAVSSGMLWTASIAGILFAAAGSIVAASFYRPQALGIGAAIAATIAGLSLWSWYATRSWQRIGRRPSQSCSWLLPRNLPLSQDAKIDRKLEAWSYFTTYVMPAVNWNEFRRYPCAGSPR